MTFRAACRLVHPGMRLEMKKRRHQPEHRAFLHLTKALSVLVDSRNYNMKLDNKSRAHAQRIAAQNESINFLRRALAILLATPEMKVDLQLELDIDE